MDKVRPKKYFGQHFLTDLNIAKSIVDSLTAKNSSVLEIGPGMGVLTDFLIPIENIDLKLVDVDAESIDFLKKKLDFDPERIIHADFLKLDLNQLFDGKKFNIIGNFPYNISSQIFFKVLDYKYLVDEVVCMLQKEVAVRLASAPGNKDYGILSVFLQAYYDIEYLFTVDENLFNPPPKVKGGVVRLRRNNVKTLDCNEALFRRIVKATFNQRRKTIRNGLKSVANIEQIINHEYMGKRPEQLSVQDFVCLTNLVEPYVLV